MKYTVILLFSLVISTIAGILMFILGCIVRFSQAMLLNKYIAGVEDKHKYSACKGLENSLDLCPTSTSFDSISVGSWANSLGALVILPGFFILLYTAVGAVGVMKKSQALLLLMFILILTSMALEYYLLDIILSSGSFHDNAKEELSEKLASDYTLVDDSNEFSKMMNALMIQGDCCGISGPSDFSLNETVEAYGVGRVTLQTPPACCSLENENPPAQAYGELLDCTGDSMSMNAIQTGCYDVLHKHFYDHYGALTIAFIMIAIIWEGLQGLTIFMIILRPTPKSPRKSVSSVGSNRGGPQPPPPEIHKKKFIPFSKVSSAVATDINRIKSTEIW